MNGYNQEVLFAPQTPVRLQQGARGVYSPDHHMFTISHLCHAPLSLVWQAWTGEEHLQLWFGPQEDTLTPLRMAFQPGGLFHYRLNTSDNNKLWGIWKYVEIIPLERLAAIVSFADKQGNVTHHPQNEKWPLEMLSVIEFRKQSDKTLVTIEWSPYNANPEEIATFDAAHIDMTIGWRGSFDRLDTYLMEIARHNGAKHFSPSEPSM